jgi:hypothetical protein
MESFEVASATGEYTEEDTERETATEEGGRR